MSYEGYLQHICENGHRFDSQDYYFGEYRCSCGAPPVWTNSVDETNCDAYGIVLPDDFEKLLHEQAEVDVCNLGHTHVIRQATYLVPCAGGPAEPNRHFWAGDQYILLKARR